MYGNCDIELSFGTLQIGIKLTIELVPYNENGFQFYPHKYLIDIEHIHWKLGVIENSDIDFKVTETNCWNGDNG